MDIFLIVMPEIRLLLPWAEEGCELRYPLPMAEWFTEVMLACDTGSDNVSFHLCRGMGLLQRINFALHCSHPTNRRALEPNGRYSYLLHMTDQKKHTLSLQWLQVCLFILKTRFPDPGWRCTYAYNSA